MKFKENIIDNIYNQNLGLKKSEIEEILEIPPDDKLDGGYNQNSNQGYQQDGYSRKKAVNPVVHFLYCRIHHLKRNLRYCLKKSFQYPSHVHSPHLKTTR